MTTPQKTCATSYYNGACPVCRSEMMRYKRDADASGAPVKWVDIARAENKDALAHLGISQDMAYRRIYILDAEGKPRVGVDGLIALWAAIPRWRWLARFVALPILRPSLSWLYDHVLARGIYESNRRRIREADTAPHPIKPNNPGNPATRA